MNFLKQQVWEENSNNSKLKTYKQKETAEYCMGPCLFEHEIVLPFKPSK